MMDKTIRWNVDPEEQQAETYRYWQSVSIGERIQATFELSREAYNFKKQVNDGLTATAGLPGAAPATER